MAFILESFLAGAAEQATDFMEAEKEEQRRKQRAEDDFDITKRGIDYRLEAQDELSRREERETQKKWALEATRTLKDLGYGDELIADLLTSKTSFADAVEVGKQNRKTGLFDSPDEIYKSFGGNSNIITEAGEIPHERYQINGEAYRTLYKPMDKSFSNLNARLTHYTSMYSKETDPVKKGEYEDQMNLTLKTMTAEAKAKQVDDGTDIFSQSGAQSRVIFALGKARASISEAQLDTMSNITNKMTGKEGEVIAADLKAVAMLRQMHGTSSTNLTTIVDAIEKATNENLISYSNKVVKAANDPKSKIMNKLTVQRYYNKENSWDDVSKKMKAFQYKPGDVIQYSSKEGKLRTIIYTGVPLTYANGQERSYIIGR